MTTIDQAVKRAIEIQNILAQWEFGADVVAYDEVDGLWACPKHLFHHVDPKVGEDWIHPVDLGLPQDVIDAMEQQVIEEWTEMQAGRA